jgi:hypothetical protein
LEDLLNCVVWRNGNNTKFLVLVYHLNGERAGLLNRALFSPNLVAEPHDSLPRRLYYRLEPEAPMRKDETTATLGLSDPVLVQRHTMVRDRDRLTLDGEQFYFENDMFDLDAAVIISRTAA